jgi:branched-subunit amino acid aminotransferase/4-amino-4-deoxychorismate lyase
MRRGPICLTRAGEDGSRGEIFELTAHAERLFESARILDFEIPFTVAQIDQARKDARGRSGPPPFAAALRGRN